MLLWQTFRGYLAGCSRVEFRAHITECGHNLPFSERGKLPLERLHYSGNRRTRWPTRKAGLLVAVILAAITMGLMVISRLQEL